MKRARTWREWIIVEVHSMNGLAKKADVSWLYAP